MKYSKIFFFGLVVMMFSCYSLDKDNNNQSAEIMENEIWDPQIILTRKEKKVVKAKSDKLYKNKDDWARLVGNVEIDFFDDIGKHTSMLYSDSAKINEKNNNLSATGNVYVISNSGYTLRTQSIIWDNNYQIIVAQDSVMFTTSDGDTLYGIGFESDSDLEEWRIFKPFGIARDGI